MLTVSASLAALPATVAHADPQRVEVPSLGTPTSVVFANPDGTVTVDQYAQPVRVRAADGAWTPVDLTLRRDRNGRVTPAAAPFDVSLSAGGPGALVALTRDGRTLELGWPGVLPTPVLNGADATYPEVLPGVDLRVRITVDGFAEALVVKDRAAAANPALSSVRFRTKVSGAQLRRGDASSLTVVGADGTTSFGAGTPMMWDARNHSAAMPMSMSADALTLTPDKGLLTGPDTAFPVYIDPSVTISSTWTMINQRHPDQSYWSYDRAEGAKVGYVDQDTNGDGWERYRSIFTISTAAVAHKHVLGAVFSANLVHSFSCSNSRTDLYAVNGTDSGTTWNNHAGSWGANLANVSNQSCNDAAKYTEWGGSELVSRVQSAANTGTVVNFGLRAYDESTDNGWKRFDPATAKLSVTYNSYPNTPANLKVDGHPCATGANRPYVGSTQPTFSATVSDPDGGALDVYFAWATINADGSYQPGWPSGHQTNVASGGTAQLKPNPPLQNGTSYAFRSQDNDGTDVSGTSGWCEFTVDTTPPVEPVVSSVGGQYPNDGNSHPGLGRSGSFTFASGGSDDVVAYRYGLADLPTTTIAADGLGGGAGISLTPSHRGLNTLSVQSVDRAGNLSGINRYTFLVDSGSPPSGLWTMDDATGSTAADASGNGHDAALSGGSSWVGGRVVAGGSDTAVRLDGSSGYAATSGPVVDTGKSFSVAAWVRMTATNGYQTVISQQGSHSSAFYLQYRADDHHWAFTMRRADTDTATSVVADSHVDPALNVWTHVAGVFDAATKQLQVYVNGVPAGSATFSDPLWSATGPLEIGRAQAVSAEGDYFPGDIDDVRVWDRVVYPDQIERLATSGTLVGEWDLDDGAGTVASDASGYNHPANLFYGAAWTDSGHDGNGGLSLDGVGAMAQTAGPVLRTDASYTVSAWVSLSDLSKTATALGEDGINTSAFTLEYRVDSGKWAFTTPARDSSLTTNTVVTSKDPAAKDTWTHLVGVYDAGLQQMRFYVNGTLAGTASDTTAWNAQGPLSIGRNRVVSPRFTNLFPGQIDDVRVYAGVLSDQEIVRLFNQ